jgi:hypothetical protein
MLSGLQHLDSALRGSSRTAAAAAAAAAAWALPSAWEQVRCYRRAAGPQSKLVQVRLVLTALYVMPREGVASSSHSCAPHTCCLDQSQHSTACLCLRNSACMQEIGCLCYLAINILCLHSNCNTEVAAHVPQRSALDMPLVFAG